MGRPPIWTEKDVVGHRFSRLIVASRGKRPSHWWCICDCGASIEISGSSLRKGNTKSCGCLKLETASANAHVHGHATKGNLTPEYQSWRGMRNRCLNRNSEDWDNYGGRGITICARWNSFADFLADMGLKPTPAHTIDRYPDRDGNYEPGNCRWATQEEQQANRRPRSEWRRRAA